MNLRVGAAPLAMGSAALLACALLAAQGSAPGTATRRVDRTKLMRDVTTLSSPAFEGRNTGSLGAAKAQAWLVDQFRTAGVAPAGTTSFLQPFDMGAANTRARQGDAGPARPDARGANVIGRLAGRTTDAKSLVVMAHFDHLGMRNGVLYPGADDNASGIAVLLAAAREFAAHRPRHPMLFAALDAEEVGFRGARTLLGSQLLPRDSVAIAINLDMVSRSRRREIFAAGTYHTPSLVPLLQDVQTRAAVTIRFGHDRPATAGGDLDDWTRSSDHGPFHEAGLPFVYFGVEDHGDYHKPTDTADRIDPSFFGDAADTIVDAIRTLDVGVN